MCHMNPRKITDTQYTVCKLFFGVGHYKYGPTTIYTPSSGTELKSIATNPPFQYVHTSKIDFSLSFVHLFV